MHLTMANLAAFSFQLRYIYSAHVLLSWDHLRSTNTPPPPHSWQIQLSGDCPIFTTACWHTNNQSNTTTMCWHVLKKQISKRPILLTSTVKMEGGGDVLQSHCIRRSSILQLVSIILHIQCGNRFPFHRSHGQCKKGRLLLPREQGGLSNDTRYSAIGHIRTRRTSWRAPGQSLTGVVVARWGGCRQIIWEQSSWLRIEEPVWHTCKTLLGEEGDGICSHGGEGH